MSIYQLLVILTASSLTTFVRGQGQRTAPGQEAGMAPPKGIRQGKAPPPHPLSMSIASSRIPGLLIVNFEKTEAVQFNYTLQCDKPDTIYTVMVKSTHPEVANIVEGHIFNVTCEDATFTTPMIDSTNNTVPTDDMGMAVNLSSTSGGNGVVTGTLNVTFDGIMIGRSFLLMFANKVGAAPNVKVAALNSSSYSEPEHQGTANVAVRPSVVGPPGPPGPSGPPGPPGMPPNIVLKGMILVIRFPTIYDEIFRVASYVIVVLATTGMGIKVDFQVIKSVLKKPLAPGIGLFSQYVCMPLIAYGVARLVPQPSPALALGIFTCGIVPGGGASNMYCYLLGGDVSLSVTMTTISSVAALGLIPFWLYTLGDTFQDEMTSVHVPFEKILETLAIVVLPIFLGMFIKLKLPKLAKIISKVLKPVLICVVIFFISAGIYLNFYIFEMIRPMQILAGCLLPYVGYAIGGIVALIFRQPWTIVKTIAIETGIQNVGIAFLILYLSLPPPDNLLSIISPAASAIMTPLPLFVITIIYTIYTRYRKRKYGEKVDDKCAENGDDNGEGRPVDSSQGKNKGLRGSLIQLCKDPEQSEAAQEMLPKES